MANASKTVEDLFYAAVTGDVEMLKACIDQGLDVNHADADGSTPLMLAAVNGNREAVEFLLVSGSDKEKKDADGWTAQRLAENAGHADIAKTIAGYGGSGGDAERKTIPKGLEEIAIVAFVSEKAEEIREKMKLVEAEKGEDQTTINEVNHLNILLFAEVNSFSKHIDREVKGSVVWVLEYLNEDFELLSKKLGRKVDKVDMNSIKSYDVSGLLNDDERMLRGITQEIYNSMVSFVSEELSIRPSEFGTKYGAYHKRLMKMRDALLDSLRTIGQEPAKKNEQKVRMANTIGARL